MGAPRARLAIAERKPGIERPLVRATGLHPVTVALLVARGLIREDEIRAFMNPTLDQLLDPSLLPDYDVGSKILIDAIQNKRRIYLHGDYDVDGVTSAAIFARFFESQQANFHVHVPHRTKEGYGIHETAVARAVEQKAEVFLTCDCGVSAVEPVAQARELGMQVVVTDHHEPGAILPNAHALINPHLAHSRYPFVHLSGAGIVFKFCAGLTRDMGLPLDKYYNAFLDLAALGTVADVMPIVSENRVIAKFGLERLAVSKKHGLAAMRALIYPGKSDLKLTTTDIGFKFGPRLNAAGRLEDADASLRLLLTRDPEEASKLAQQLEEVNLRRRMMQQEATDQAIAQVMESGHHDRNALVVFDENWHPGLVGLIAGRLVEHFYRPAFALTAWEGTAKGSGRSIPGFNLFQMIQDMGEFVTGGGHEMAAGISLSREQIAEFASALHEYAGTQLTAEQLIPTLWVDAALELSEISLELLDELALLEPHGEANPQPTFLFRDLRVAESKRVGKENNVLQLKLEDSSGASLAAVRFFCLPDAEDPKVGSTIHVIGNLMKDEFRGVAKPKLRLQEVFPAEISIETVTA